MISFPEDTKIHSTLKNPAADTVKFRLNFKDFHDTHQKKRCTKVQIDDSNVRMTLAAEE